MWPPFTARFSFSKIILLNPFVMLKEIFGHIIFLSKVLTRNIKPFLASPKCQNILLH